MKRSTSFDPLGFSRGSRLGASHRGSMTNLHRQPARGTFGANPHQRVLRSISPEPLPQRAAASAMGREQTPVGGRGDNIRSSAETSVAAQIARAQLLSDQDSAKKTLARREPQKPNVVFLDIDGVLHSIRVTRQDQLFNPMKMALLKKILKDSNAQIVMSSAWRRTTNTFRMACAMLRQHGLPQPIGVTPDYGACGKRSAEILSWVARYGITNWVAIDDLDLALGEPRMRGHFIKTNPLEGITTEQTEMAVKMIKSTDTNATLNRSGLQKGAGLASS